MVQMTMERSFVEMSQQILSPSSAVPFCSTNLHSVLQLIVLVLCNTVLFWLSFTALIHISFIHIVFTN